jgi:hypothetical protein
MVARLEAQAERTAGPWGRERQAARRGSPRRRRPWGRERQAARRGSPRRRPLPRCPPKSGP